MAITVYPNGAVEVIAPRGATQREVEMRQGPIPTPRRVDQRSTTILVEHELNLRIAQVQSRATLWSAGIGALAGVAAAIVGAIVAFVLTSSQIPPQKEAKTNQADAERKTDSATKQNTDVGAPVWIPHPVPNAAPGKQPAETKSPDAKK